MAALVDGVTNSEVPLRELRERGYTGGRSILKEFAAPLRPLVRRRPPGAMNVNLNQAPPACVEAARDP